jgi:hypothetical protein
MSVVSNSVGGQEDWANAGEKLHKVFHVWEGYVEPA